MKIGVLTWRLSNYGTALQAFALVSYLNGMEDVDCKLLNYNLPNKNELVSLKKKNKEIYKKVINRIQLGFQERRNLPYYVKYNNQIQEKGRKFQEFYNNIPQDKIRAKLENAEYFDNNFDAFIVGADQVWNPKYFCETYFLDFVSNNKRNAYAPSIAVSCLNRFEREFLKKRLNEFQCISVRERTGVGLLKEILPQKNIENVLDPTFLFSDDEWLGKMSNTPIIDGKYIFVYFLSPNKWYKKAIEEIKKQLNIDKIVYVLSNDMLYFHDKENEVMIDIGPLEFLNLIKASEYVITDSYHGVCFSINFQKQFSCLERFSSKKKDGENSRIIDLMELLQLKNGSYGNYFCKQNAYKIVDIDYVQINKILEEQRILSKDFLNSIINNKNNIGE